jgi:hypothetical protein
MIKTKLKVYWPLFKAPISWYMQTLLSWPSWMFLLDKRIAFAFGLEGLMSFALMTLMKKDWGWDDGKIPNQLSTILFY